MNSGNSLGLPTALNAKQHLDSKKKSDSRNVHPGYSMFEWNVLCQSGQDLTGVGGQLRTISLEELAQHSTEKDAWTAVRGKVYNITHFMKFHPGGKPQLMRGAGNDCTQLFDKIHVWVNSEHMLEKCLVGTLETPTRRHKTQTLSVGAFPPSTSSTTPVELSLPVPSVVRTHSQASDNDEGTLSLQMLRQARIHSNEPDDEEVKIQVPHWIQPLPVTTPLSLATGEQLGTSVDPPELVGYDTAV